jgi:hypothetical protein
MILNHSLTLWAWMAALAVAILYVIFRVVVYGGYGKWPTAEGKIESYGRVRRPGGASSPYVCTVYYSYMVNGSFYSGEWDSNLFPSEATLMAYLREGMPIGKIVQVHYSPTKPTRSILAEESEPEPMDESIKLNLS